MHISQSIASISCTVSAPPSPPPGAGRAAVCTNPSVSTASAARNMCREEEEAPPFAARAGAPAACPIARSIPRSASATSSGGIG